MPKNSMKQALGASLSAETDAFQQRLARADAQFSQAPSASAAVADAAVADTPVADTPATTGEPPAPPVAKVLREAFTIPESEHGQIEAIRAQMLSGAVAVSKSQVLRAGLLLLFEADENARRAVFERLERVKTGRPKTV